MELFLLVTLPKDYINISGNAMKLPFIIPVVRKIFPLCISQFNKPDKNSSPTVGGTDRKRKADERDYA